MSRVHTFIAVFFLLSGIMAVYPQNSQTILPHDSTVITLLHSLLLEQGKEPLSTAGPFSIGELRMMLDRIDPSTLSEAGRLAYRTIADEIGTAPAAKPMALTIAAHPAASVEGYFHTNTDAASTEWQEGYNERLPLASIPTDIWIGDHVYADFDLELRQNHDALNPLLVPDNWCNWTLDFNILDYEIPQRAFAAVGGESWSFSIGRDSFSWGNGQTGNLLVSDAPDFQEFARLSLYWPYFKYSALWVQLYSDWDRYRSPLSGSDAKNTDPAYYPRNFFLHRLDFSLWDRLSVSLSEGILIGGITPDLVYLNPLMIFHDLFRWGFASSTSGLDLSWNPWRYVEVYGQAAYNQIQTPYELIRYGTGAAESPGAAAYLGGVRARLPAWRGYVDTGAEAVLVQPWMYLRENELTSYRWWRYMCSNVPGSRQWVSSALGYFTGPDAVVYSLWVSYDVPGLFTAKLDFKRIAKGEQDFETPYAEDEAAVALVSPTGIVEYANVLHFGGSVDPFPFLRFAADLYWIAVEDYGNVSGAVMEDFQASVSVTVHTDL
jgi:hypothetical protein